MHIIDELILERATKLHNRPLLWKLIQPALYKMLGYKHAVRMADAVGPLPGRGAFHYLSTEMSVNPRISGYENIPADGPCVIIANHPTGLADGVFVFDSLKTVRPDHVYLANADALRVIPKCEDIIIPVEWVKEKRTPAKTRKTLHALNTALGHARAVVIFPSGTLAKLTWRGLVDKPWNTTAVAVAKKRGVPIIPLNIKSRNSWLYYVFAALNAELRDITLFHELLNKKGAKPTLVFGKPIDPASLPREARAATEAVRRVVESL